MQKILLVIFFFAACVNIVFVYSNCSVATSLGITSAGNPTRPGHRPGISDLQEMLCKKVQTCDPSTNIESQCTRSISNTSRLSATISLPSSLNILTVNQLVSAEADGQVLIDFFLYSNCIGFISALSCNDIRFGPLKSSSGTDFDVGLEQLFSSSNACKYFYTTDYFFERREFYLSPDPYRTGGKPKISDAALFDFRNSGSLDLAVLKKFEDEPYLQILTNDGRGNFNLGPELKFEKNTDSFALIDINQDKRIDFVIGMNDSQKLSLYVSQPNGSLKYAWSINSLNNSGFYDVKAFLGPDQRPRISFSSQNPTRIEIDQITENGATTELNILGIDSNMISDYAILSPTEAWPYRFLVSISNVGIFLWESNGTDTQRRQVNLDFKVDIFGSHIWSSDLNLDGFMDMIVTGISNSTMTIAFGPEFGPSMSQKVILPQEPLAIVGGKFNRSNLSDIALLPGQGDYFVLIPFKDSTDQNPHPRVYATGSKFTRILSGDINGDGLLDIVLIDELKEHINILQQANR